MNHALDPLAASQHIRRAYIEYLVTRHTTRNAQLRKEFMVSIENDLALTKGPYLQTATAYENGQTIRQLVEQKVLHPGFLNLPDAAFPLDRPLYVHQERAVRKVNEGRNLIIATGTGSGKTEGFLLPILNHLLKEKDAGTLSQPGVRALLLYPMNALANDQIKRIRDLLQAFPDITFGRFIGDTQEEYRDAADTYRQRLGFDPTSNELISRSQMRERPPHILLTNYAMLEYLLLRPSDTSLFDGMTGDHWRYVVLDEVHVYNGAQGAEIAMLLRRVKDRVTRTAPKSLQFIGTSATLGSGTDELPSLAEFASQLFNQDVTTSDIIQPTKRPHPRQGTWSISVSAIDRCLQKLEGSPSVSDLSAILEPLGAPVPLIRDSVSQYLGRALVVENNVALINVLLESGAQTPEDLSRRILGGTEDAHQLIRLIELTSHGVRPDSNSQIIPARYHFLLRALEGAFYCIAPDHPDGEPRLRLARFEYCPSCILKDLRRKMFEIGACNRCGEMYLVGRQTDINGKTVIVPAGIAETGLMNLLLSEPANQSEEDEDEIADNPEADIDVDQRVLCVECGSLTEGQKSSCDCQAPKPFVTVPHPRKQGDPLRKCGSCNGRSNIPIVSRFLSGQDAPVAVIAAALYQEIPPSIRDRANSGIGQGRKLLLFSDSRQDAAFFASYFERTYSRAVERRMIWKELLELRDDSPRFEDLVHRVRQTAQNNFVLDPNQSTIANDDRVRTWLMREVLAVDRRQSLDGVGLAEIAPAIPNNLVIPPIFGKLGFSDVEALDLALLLLETLRRRGTVWLPNGVDISNPVFSPRNHVTTLRYEGSAPGVLAWMPSRGSNTRLDLVSKIFQTRKINSDAKEFLGDLWQHWFSDPKHAWIQGPLRSENDSRKGTTYALDPQWIAFHRKTSERNGFICSSCQQITWRNISGICPEFKCAGTLRPMDDALLNHNHYRSLYRELNPIGMVVDEHTGQLDSEYAAKVQEDFIKGKVNALSCSTTFELGVDVGEVQAVLLRNMPPSAANYVQRAGRAGRRAGSAAVITSFAQRRNHDLYYYQNPTLMIDGHVSTPIISLSNAQIVRRHLHAIAFAAFEREHVAKGGEEHRNIGSFFYSSQDTPTGAQQFASWLRSRPQHLLSAASNITPDILREELQIDSGGWIDDLLTTNDQTQAGWFERAEQDAVGDLQELEAEQQRVSVIINQHLKDGQGSKAQSMSRYQTALLTQLQTIKSRPLLNFLAQRVVLPKYGFPVDVVPLDISRANSPEASRLDLNRDLRIAITDYAPGARVVANKALWESVGIKIPPGRSLLGYSWAICKDCDAFRSQLGHDPGVCPVCGSSENGDKGTYVSPVFGFLGRPAKEQPGEARPERLGNSEFHFSNFMSEVQPDFESITSDSLVKARFSKQGQITVLNRGPEHRRFRICFECGYAAENPRRTSRQRNKDSKIPPHERPTKPGSTCNGNLSVRELGHQYLTDVVEVSIGVPMHPKESLSTIYALLAATKALGISRADVNGTLRRGPDSQGPSMVLFDSVPGGAGHVRRILERFDTLLLAARQVVESCECGLDSSCYACLRTYDNQQFHEKLSREDALRVLDQLALTTTPPTST